MLITRNCIKIEHPYKLLTHIALTIEHNLFIFGFIIKIIDYSHSILLQSYCHYPSSTVPGSNVMMEVDSPRRSSVDVKPLIQPIQPSMQDTSAFYPNSTKASISNIPSNDVVKSSLMYQNLKGHLNGSSSVHQSMNFVPVQFSSPQMGPQAVQRSVFVMDSKHTENQDIVELVQPPQPPQIPMASSTGLPIISDIWNGDEKSILRDIEQDNAMFGDSNRSVQVTDENPEEDLKLRVKRESNLFNPDIVHTEVTYPARKSAEERASILLNRAFNTAASPGLAQVSADFAKRVSMRMSMGSDGFGRMSSGMFLPDHFRLSNSVDPLPFNRLSGNFDSNPINQMTPQGAMSSMSPGNLQFLGGMMSDHMAPMPPPMSFEQIQRLSQVQIPLHDGTGGLIPNPTGADGIAEMQFAAKLSHRACVRCHKVKKRCIRPGPGMPCKSCTKKRLFCESRKDGRSTNKGGRKRPSNE